MDIAVKRGFAIGFVVLAALAAFYGCQPQFERAKQALGGAGKPAPLAGPSGSASTPPAPGTADASPSDASPSDHTPSDAPPRSTAAPQAGDAASSPQAVAPTPAAPAPPVASAGTPPPAGSEATPSAPGSIAAIAPQTGAAPLKPAQDASKGGAFDIVRVEPSGEMVLAGRCAANCSAELTANGKTHETVKADAQGHWVMTPAPLPPGDYQLGLRIRLPDGRQETSSQTLTVAIPTPPSKDVVVVLNAPDAPSKILQQPEPKVAGAPGQGDRLSAAVGGPANGPGAGPGAPAAAPLGIGAIEAENGRVFAQGTGPADARLRLYLNNALLATATIGSDNRWSLRVEQGLAPGAYQVRADQLDATGGKVVARVEAGFTYAPQIAAADAAPAAGAPVQSEVSGPAGSPPAAALPRDAAADPTGVRQGDASGPSNPGDAVASDGVADAPSERPSADAVVASIDTAQVRRGDSLWRISRTTYGRGMRYTEIYQANGGQIRNPDLIYPGQVLVIPEDSARAPTRPARP